MLSKKEKIGFWSIIFLLHSLALAFNIAYNKPYITNDSYEYLAVVSNFWTHHIFYCYDLALPVDMRGYTLRPIGYPLFIGSLKLIFSNDYWVCAVQGGLSLLNIWFYTQFLKLLAIPEKHGLVAVIFGLFFFPTQLVYCNFLMSDIVLQTVVMTVLYALLHLRNTKIANHLTPKQATKKTKLNRYHFLYIGSLIMGLLLKPIFIFAVFAHTIWALFLAFRHRNFVLTGLAVFPFFVYISYAQYNKNRTGYWQYSAIAPMNLSYIYAPTVLEAAEGATARAAFEAKIDTLTSFTPQNYAQKEDSITQLSKAVLWKHPLVFITKSIEGVFVCLLEPSRFDVKNFIGGDFSSPFGLMYYLKNKDFEGLKHYFFSENGWLTLYLACVVASNALILLGFCLFLVQTFQRQREHLDTYFEMLVMATIFLFLITTGLMGIARFKLPIFWLLLLGFPLLYARFSAFANRFFKPKTLKS